MPEQSATNPGPTAQLWLRPWVNSASRYEPRASPASGASAIWLNRPSGASGSGSPRSGASSAGVVPRQRTQGLMLGMDVGLAGFGKPGSGHGTPPRATRVEPGGGERATRGRFHPLRTRPFPLGRMPVRPLRAAVELPRRTQPAGRRQVLCIPVYHAPGSRTSGGGAGFDDFVRFAAPHFLLSWLDAGSGDGLAYRDKFSTIVIRHIANFSEPWRPFRGSLCRRGALGAREWIS